MSEVGGGAFAVQTLEFDAVRELLARHTSFSAGRELALALLPTAELEEAGPEAEDVGVRLTVDIVSKLRAIPGVAGVHVMGLGQEDPVRKVIEVAGLHPRPAFLPQQADRLSGSGEAN